MLIFGSPNVKEMETRRNVKGLIKALQYKEWQVRSEAARALGYLRDPRAIEPLITLLRDSDKEVRRTAAQVLGKLSDIVILDEYKRAYRDVCETAARALIEIGAPSVVPLIAALRDDCRDVREAAAKALGSLRDPRAVASLIVALWDEDRWIRSQAAEALGRIGDNRAIEPLIIALKDDNWGTRTDAAEALDKLNWKPSKDVAGALYWMARGFQSINFAQVVESIDSCVAIGAPAVEPLIAALKEESELVRKYAAEALVKIGNPSVEPLISALGVKDDWIRLRAADVLGRIGDNRAVESLIAALRDHDRLVRHYSAEALGRIGDPRAVEPLITALGDKDDWIRLSASEALGRIGDPRAVESLIAALRDRDTLVRHFSAESLNRINWKPSEDSIGATYWIARGSEFINNCVTIGAPAVEPLIVALEDGVADVRIASARVLVMLYSGNLLPPRHRQLILSNRPHITSKRESYNVGGSCSRSDYSDHYDTGIGVDFPL